MSDSFEKIYRSDSLIRSYPWIEEALEHLNHANMQGRFPQSIIISGPENIGLGFLHKTLAWSIICGDGKLHPCGSCNNCSLTKSSSHPDLRFLGGEATDLQVNIDNIRASIGFLSTKPMVSDHKVLSINLNYGYSYGSISAILKILEEPPERSHIIIRIDNLSKLPGTILSRCQNIKITQPTCEIIEKWYENYFSEERDSDVTEGVYPASSLLPTNINYSRPDHYEVADLMISFFWTLCMTKNDFDLFFQKVDEFSSQSILDGCELAIYLIILLQYKQSPPTIFVTKHKLRELGDLGEKIGTLNLLNNLSYIANLKRLCFNSAGIKAGDITDLIFTNTLSEFCEK